MAYLDFPVEIPKGTLIAKVSGKKYVYFVEEKVYKKDKKYNSDIRKCIGKVIENTNTMYPNDAFRIYFPNEYEALNEVHLESDKLILSNCLKIGFTGSFFGIAENLKITDLLIRYFDDDESGSNEVSQTILNYAAKVVATQNATIASYPFYARENLMLGGKVTSESTLCDIFKRIKKDKIQAFTRERIKLNSDTQGVFLSCDGSNIKTDSTDIEIAEIGHNKNGNEENQVAFTLVTEQNNYRPLILNAYKGSTHDLNAISPIVSLLKEYDINKITYIFDRGYFSTALMRKILNQNNDFLIMAKENTKIKQIYDKYYDEIHSFDSYDSELDMHHFTHVEKLFKNIDKSVYFHIFYNPENKQIIEKKVKIELANDMTVLKKLLGLKITEEELGQYSEKFDLYMENDVLTSFAVSKTWVENRLKYAGMFVLVTSKLSDANYAYTKYRNRDYTEKLFAMLKTSEDLEVLRSRDEDHLLGKVFSLFIGLIIRNEIFIKTKELRKNSKDKNAYTTTSCIRELSCIEAINVSGKKYKNIRAYTKKQKAIIKALNLDIKIIEKGLFSLNKWF